MPEVGDVVAGYQLEERLGAGAMGAVFRGRRGHEPPVVLKFIESQMQNARLRDRFAREGQALARLPRHPALVSIHAVLSDPPCLVMDLVPGSSLADHLAKRKRFEPREAARIARDAARGMIVVHRHGLLHRDLKPANLLLTPASQLRIVDFGLVKDVFATALTAPGQLLGTGPYMAPEVWAGEPSLGPQVDVFALGATLYELISGQPAFAGRTLDELSEAVSDGDYVPLKNCVPDLPEGLEEIVAQFLSGERRFRYATMAAAADDLERFLHGEPCEVARLEDPRGATLIPLGARLVVGSGERSDLVLPGADAQHAQIRRRPQGYELRDLRSQAGTFRGAERVSGSVLLRDGDLLRFGSVPVIVRDPRDRAHTAPFLAAPRRHVVTREEALTLLALNDPRTIGLAAEWSEAEPGFVDDVAARLAPLGAVPGLAAALTAEVERWASWLTSKRPSAAWLAEWARRRLDVGDQVYPPLPTPDLSLLADAGEPGWQRLPLGDEELLLIGRDPKCHVRLRNRTVSRHHTSLLRLARTWLVRDEKRSTPSLLDGQAIDLTRFALNQVLRLGDVELRLSAAKPAPDLCVGPRTADALLAIGHPSVCTLAVRELAHTEPVAEFGARLYPRDPSRASAAAAAAARARATRRPLLDALLARWLNASTRTPPAELQASLQAANLGPQVQEPNSL